MVRIQTGTIAMNKTCQSYSICKYLYEYLVGSIFFGRPKTLWAAQGPKPKKCGQILIQLTQENTKRAQKYEIWASVRFARVTCLGLFLICTSINMIILDNSIPLTYDVLIYHTAH